MEILKNNYLIVALLLAALALGIWWLVSLLAKLQATATSTTPSAEPKSAADTLSKFLRPIYRSVYLSAKPRTRLLSQADKDKFLRYLKASTIRGKVDIVARMDKEACEYATQLQALFREAGFEVVPRDMDKMPSDVFDGNNFTGERLFRREKISPPHLGLIQAAFREIGRTLLGDVNPELEEGLVVISIGDRP